ncbi:MAG TPA: hypothetical protein VLW53_01270, partial [Candidatus Eisenbacteria bacterium]|nr:hypothetical protein [Candidatus Eisenbacteria bacterium]
MTASGPHRRKSAPTHRDFLGTPGPPGAWVELLQPLTLRPGVRTSNRIVFAAHVTNLAVDGLPGERMCAYYERRARGGAGLVVLEEAFVHPSSHPYDRAIRGEDPAIVPAYRR